MYTGRPSADTVEHLEASVTTDLHKAGATGPISIEHKGKHICMRFSRHTECTDAFLTLDPLGYRMRRVGAHHINVWL